MSLRDDVRLVIEETLERNEARPVEEMAREVQAKHPGASVGRIERMIVEGVESWRKKWRRRW